MPRNYIPSARGTSPQKAPTVGTPPTSAPMAPTGGAPAFGGTNNRIAQVQNASMGAQRQRPGMPTSPLQNLQGMKQNSPPSPGMPSLMGGKPPQMQGPPAMGGGMGQKMQGPPAMGSGLHQLDMNQNWGVGQTQLKAPPPMGSGLGMGGGGMMRQGPPPMREASTSLQGLPMPRQAPPMPPQFNGTGSNDPYAAAGASLGQMQPMQNSAWSGMNNQMLNQGGNAPQQNGLAAAMMNQSNRR